MSNGLSFPRQHTKYPYVTGTSVLGVKYKDGVLIAADTLAAYGATKRYKSFQRVVKVRIPLVFLLPCYVASSGEASPLIVSSPSRA